MNKEPGDNERKSNGEPDRKLIIKGQKYETASELGVIDANTFVGVRIRPVAEDEVRRIVDEARFHIIGFK